MARRTRRASPQTTAVMEALGEHPSQWQYGYDLCQVTGLKSGVVYPILMRLSDRGILESRWEAAPPVGRPPRHLYRLSDTGREALADLVAVSVESQRSIGSPRLTGGPA